MCIRDSPARMTPARSRHCSYRQHAAGRLSLIVARSAEGLYDMISNMTRIGERSPVCKACRWDDGSAVHVGDWFTGRNLLPDRTWETRSEAIAAETVSYTHLTLPTISRV